MELDCRHEKDMHVFGDGDLGPDTECSRFGSSAKFLGRW